MAIGKNVDDCDRNNLWVLCWQEYSDLYYIFFREKMVQLYIFSSNKLWRLSDLAPPTDN